MNQVTVRTKSLSQALFSLASAGCEEVEVSIVAHAIKVEGIRGDVKFPLHVWSKEAEDTEVGVGKGEQLSEEEGILLNQGKCPKCEGQLYKVGKDALAIAISCDAGHCFWVPPLPLLPEYIGQYTEPIELAREVAEEVEEEIIAEPTATAGEAEGAIKALEEGEVND